MEAEYHGIECSNCGKHGEGEKTENGRLRCKRCGSFGKKLEGYCLEHDVSFGKLAYDSCPMCQEERRVEAMEQEMHERRADPSMHPSVDARRF